MNNFSVEDAFSPIPEKEGCDQFCGYNHLYECDQAYEHDRVYECSQASECDRAYRCYQAYGRDQADECDPVYRGDQVDKGDQVCESDEVCERMSPDDIFMEASGILFENHSESPQSQFMKETSEDFEPLGHLPTPEQISKDSELIPVSEQNSRQESVLPKDVNFLKEDNVVEGVTQGFAVPKLLQDDFLATELDDSLGSLIAPEPTFKKKAKRLSTVSVASSIAAMMPLFWNAKNESASPPQDAWNDDSPNFCADEEPPRVSSAKTGPRINYRRVSRQADRITNSLKDLLGVPASSAKKPSKNLGVAAQTVADWKRSLDSSFDYCLGNTSRFQLEVPSWNLSNARDSTARSKFSSFSHLKTWQRKSRMFFSSLGNSSGRSVEPLLNHNNSSVSALTGCDTVPGKMSDESLLWNTPSLSMGSTSETPEESIRTAHNSRAWLSVSRETIDRSTKPSKRYRVRNFLRTLKIH